jgi:hypothetical protein
MAQDVRTYVQKIVQYLSGQKVPVDLQRGLTNRYYKLRLTGQPAIALGDNTLANTARGAEWAYVANIELLVNGSNVIRSFSGNQLWWLNYFMYGTPPPITPAIGDGATANPAFDVTLLLPSWMFNCVRPMDSALDTSKLSDLKLRVQWGAYTAMNASATAWTVEPQIEISAVESSNVSGPFGLQTIYQVSKTITATDPKLQVYFPTGEWYRGFLINTTDAGVDQGDILNHLRFKSGAAVFFDQPGISIQQDIGWLQRGIHRPIPAQTAAGVYDTLQRSASSSVAGWYFVDFVTDGRLSECIDTTLFSEFYLEADVTVGAGTTIMDILPIRFRPAIRK